MTKLIGILLLAVSGAANATIMTIEPDDYAEGMRVGIPEAAVSFIDHRTGSDVFTYRAAFAVTEPSCLIYTVCKAPTGSKVLNDGTLTNGVMLPTATFSLTNFFFGLHPESVGVGKLEPETIGKMRYFTGIRVDFANPTNYFSADVYGPTDPARLFAFAADGTFLAEMVGNGDERRVDLGPGCNYPFMFWQDTVSVQRETADIAFVIFGSSDSAAYIDAVRFDVPEPAPIALFVVGILALAIRRGAPRADAR